MTPLRRSVRYGHPSLPNWNVALLSLFRGHREILLLRALDHPNIISIFEMWEHKDDIYLAEPMMEADLHRIVRSSQAPRHCLQRLCAGLSPCLALGSPRVLVHRVAALRGTLPVLRVADAQGSEVHAQCQCDPP